MIMFVPLSKSSDVSNVPSSFFKIGRSFMVTLAIVSVFPLIKTVGVLLTKPSGGDSIVSSGAVVSAKA